MVNYEFLRCENQYTPNLKSQHKNPTMILLSVQSNNENRFICTPLFSLNNTTNNQLLRSSTILESSMCSCGGLTLGAWQSPRSRRASLIRSFPHICIWLVSTCCALSTAHNSNGDSLVKNAWKRVEIVSHGNGKWFLWWECAVVAPWTPVWQLWESAPHSSRGDRVY